ncbi:MULTISPECIES: glutathione S-transferase [Moorena]|uniref:Glutathione S-transferase n=2 Tax=Moorena producens TaxID=1155739 RepID=A0A1D9FZD2_MOOP1|nr:MULTISPECIES: glutathione S-transferase [Moorena]NEQ15200.1 glutathione S-transferase [Moorena sp. SIO3E2]AOY80681.1 glutathione S-transferase [Moorena producens JHB]EGJ32168.1 glutathione S-transferase [Moorena producens 3L]NEP34129.1 glutathione S-transferase [Moorena sp. SIO3B2]NEP67117.1 glutathione S-transferase [Moorena sp. SIO3A5]
MIKLYDYQLSGNCYKVRLMLSLLGLEHETVWVDLDNGEHKSPEFLELNSFGQVPVLTDGDLVFQDAQAILVYLARRYGSEDWLPLEAEAMSRVMRWLSTTAGEIRQGPEFARLYYKFNVKTVNIEVATQKSATILTLLDNHLSDRAWLELDHPTIADIACFPYVSLSPDAKISLDAYPNVVSWMERIKQLPGYIAIA